MSVRRAQHARASFVSDAGVLQAAEPALDGTAGQIGQHFIQPNVVSPYR